MIYRVLAITVLLSVVFWLGAAYHVAQAQAQSEDDVGQFLQTGQDCYSRGEFANAVLEFENVLLIDRQNFAAKVWLAQVYVDMKDLEKARKILMEASLQAPDHPRVIQLQKMLGEMKKPAKAKPASQAVKETFDLTASDTGLRRFGLVVPEDKVTHDTSENNLLVFEDMELEPEKPKEKELDLLNYFDKDSSPLSEVFTALDSQGLNAALDLYFVKVIADPALAAQDDRGLVAKGNELYAARYTSSIDDLEACYYYGSLQFINGLYSEAEKILGPLKTNPGNFAERLQPIFAALSKWRETENQRLLALKQAEEDRLAMEAYEKAETEKKKDDIWAKLKKKRAGTASGSALVGGAAGVAEAAALHSEGYDLYKKGKLDDAIAKYEEALAKQADNPEFSYHLGLAWTDKGLAGDAQSFDRAITAFQRVISLAPNDKLGRDAQAMIKDIDSAKKTLGE